MASPLLFVVFLLYPSLILVHAYSDLEALLELKSSLVGPLGSGLSDWAAPTSPSPPSLAYCSFSGVSCDADGRVTSIELVDLPLSGTLPPEIGLLSKLINLTLSGNNLTGPLPAEIRDISSLKLLNLSRNVFGGTIPGEMLVGLADLEVFDAYNNNFSGRLPAEFARLRKLRFLSLAGNYFSGEIPEVYSEFQSLTHLGLQGNSLTGKIPAGLAKIANLAELYLGYYNTFSGGIPPEFGSMTHLQLLDLGMCNLSGEIPPSLGNLKHLHSLFLQINNLTGQLSPELSGMTSLMSLDISMNDLTGKIPETFSDLKNLTLLNLFHNNFQGPVPSFIGDLSNLEVLHIWSNNFTLGLPKNLGTNKKLIMLDVSENRLTGLVPKNLCLGGKLKTLILMDNFFYGPLPEEIGSCGSLMRIRIKNNFLNETVPDGIFRMPSLEILELDGNYFTGRLPEEIAAWNLGRLSLSGNLMSGSIPPAVGNMTNLEILLLDENRFSGDIPAEIFGIEKLTKLVLSGNCLTGQIPVDFANGSLLSFIDLSQNELAGGISGNIARLQNLNVLNVSRNNLQGKIPVAIGLMKSLTVLDLSYNNFSGQVPLTGLLKDLDDRFFAGNPNLCSRHSSFCSSSSRRPRRNSRARSRPTVIAIIITVIVLLVLFVISILFKSHIERSKRWKLTAFQKLDFMAEDVVKCLRDENVIGKGGAGSVYLGSMPNGVDIAIKRLTRRAGNDHGFMAEIRTMGNIRHRNIVRLLGYLCNNDTNMLLYEYMPNGSLGEVLHGPKGAHLRWESRFKVAVEAAKGLCYLHHDCSPPIIHRDVKSNNILLDSDYEAHVADFGLAKFLGDGGGSECVSSVAGSYGYIAPEYAYTLKIDQKSDVYSFGVVLLELITGRRPVGGFGEGMDIVRWVMRTKSELSASEDPTLVLAVIDPRLDGYPLDSVVGLFRIARMCVANDSSNRPTMRGVVHMLENPLKPTLGIVDN